MSKVAGGAVTKVMMNTCVTEAMNRKKALTILALSVLMMPSIAFSQDNRASHERLVPQITEARQYKSVGAKSTNPQDSVISGSSSNGLIASSVNLPLQCSLDNTLKGCDGYCAANPTASGCAPAPAPAPSPPDQGGGAGGGLPPAPTGQIGITQLYDHCGEEVQASKLVSSGCTPVRGGYHCPLGISAMVNLNIRCR